MKLSTKIILPIILISALLILLNGCFGVPITYVLTTVAVPPEGGSVSGAGTYNSGTMVPITASPATGWEFVDWSGDITDPNESSSITMNGDKAVIATFDKQQVTLTVSVAGAGSGTIDPIVGSHTYNYGDVVNLTAIPDTGSTFGGWSGDITDPNESSSITMNGDKAVIATFDKQQVTLTVSVAGAGSGTIDPIVGSHTYNYGDVVNLTATPDTGSTFGGWSGDITDPNESSSITMNGDKAVIATFDKQQVTLTVSVAGAGSGTIDPIVGSHTYNYGDVVNLTAIPDTGSTFGGWSGDITDPNESSSITMNGDKAVIATFDKQQVTLTVSVAGAGSGTVSVAGAGSGTIDPIVGSHTYNYGDVVNLTATPDPIVGSHTYNYGDVVNLTATPDTGSTFGGWSGDITDPNESSSITMNGDKAVIATFVKKPEINLSHSGEAIINGWHYKWIDVNIKDAINLNKAEITLKYGAGRILFYNVEGGALMWPYDLSWNVQSDGYGYEQLTVKVTRNDGIEVIGDGTIMCIKFQFMSRTKVFIMNSKSKLYNAAHNEISYTIGVQMLIVE